MLSINYNPDVLSCLANLSNDEVFTPPKLVSDILDMLPQELFTNKETTFLDPVSKSGVFLREIAKRLMIGLETEIPDQQERINHIFNNQIYGIAITELTALLSRRSVYCSKNAKGKYSICETFDTESGNIKFDYTNHTWKNGKCTFCNASEELYSRDDQLETHAYQFIHTNNPEKIFNMKFDVIIGNPPYQLSDGGSGTGISAKPIYNHFVEQAIKLNPNYLVMIIPSRWFAGGKGLNDFREKMLKDRRIVKIVDFMSSKDCFPGVNIAGGVNYFLWNKSHDGICEIVNMNNGIGYSSKRELDEFDVFIRDNKAIGIINKILSKDTELMADKVLSRNPFGFSSKERGLKKVFPDCVKLISSAGAGYVPRNIIKNNTNQIDRYKVTIGKVVPSNGEVDVSPEQGYKVITLPKIIGKNTIHTESYMLLCSFDNLNEAENFKEYMKLKLPRFLLKQTLSSMNISRGSFMFVPFLDYSRSWSNQDLYNYFDLNDEEIELVNYLMRDFDE
jgi:site-specific DNA-methyltransferase (adenine-specific)